MPFSKRTLGYIKSAYRGSMRRYRADRKRRPRARLTQGRVPGAGTRMSPNVSLSAEVKFKDTAVNFNSLTGDWALAMNNALAGITQGTGNGNRVGRSIKIVGVIYRFNVFSGTGQPFSVDIGCDKQANSAIPVIGDIYASVANTSLPNPVYERRYQFWKRHEVKDPNSTVTIVSGSINKQQVVNYSGNLGTIADMEDANLFVSISATRDVDIEGSFRVLYVDF